MGKLKLHAEHAGISHPVRQLLRLDAAGLAHSEDIVPFKDLSFELLQKIKDPRRVRRHGVDADRAVRRIRLPVQELRRLFDVADGIDAEAADPFVQPEIRRVEQCPAHLRVLPVEIRLLLCEGVVIILLPLLAPGPDGTAEDTAPVGGNGLAAREVCPGLLSGFPSPGVDAFSLRIPPDIPVRLRIGPVLFRLQEPGMPVGAVIVYNVHHDPDAALPRFRHQPVEVFHGAVGRVNGGVV